MGAKYTAKWGVQTAGMNFQTRSRIQLLIYHGFEPIRPFSAYLR
ncbi:DUF6783 domain-containing protein [Enterocloster hominis (ex Hitch et al. 2024)]